MVGESQIHRVKPGQRVRMKSNIFEFLQYGYIEAILEEISLEPYVFKESETYKGGTYRVIAKIERTPVPLVLGSTLEARIILQRVPLWKYLLPRDAH